MQCPACGDRSIPFLKAWVVGPWLKLKCPNCRNILRIQKEGVGKFSSYVLGIPMGVLGGLGIIKVFWNLPIFLTVAVAVLSLDFFIDSRTVSLRVDGETKTSGEEMPPNNLNDSD